MFRQYSHLRNWPLLDLRLRHISERVFREYPRFQSFHGSASDSSLSYILGSAGTLMFDITIVSQSFLYRKLTDKEKAVKRDWRASRGVAEEEGLLSAGATGAEEGASPPHRRRTVSSTDDNV